MGLVAQLVEHLSYEQRVTSSTLVETNFFATTLNIFHKEK